MNSRLRAEDAVFSFRDGGGSAPLVFPEGGHPPHGKKGKLAIHPTWGVGGRAPPHDPDPESTPREEGREPLPIRDPTTHQAQDALGEVVGRADGVLTREHVG